MANEFYIRMKQKEREQYREGVTNGMKFAFDLVAIALNHEFGFGNDRIERLEKYLVGLVKDINVMNEPDVTNARIEKELKRIRGADYERG